MPKNDDVIRSNSILIVSANEQFTAIVKRSLNGFITIDVKKSIAAARRSVLEKSYDIVVVNTPLSDETGEDFAMDISERFNSSVLLVTPEGIYDEVLEKVTDYGILAIAKPTTSGRIGVAIRFMIACQNRIRQMEKKSLTVEEKMEEIRIVSKAKILLVQKKGMSEDEAHRFIGKQAMNNGVSRKKVAEKILDDLS